MRSTKFSAGVFQKLDKLIHTTEPTLLESALQTFFNELQLQHHPTEEQIEMLATAAESAMRRNLSVAYRLIEKALQQTSPDLAGSLRAEVLHIAGMIAGKMGKLGTAFQYLAQALHTAAQVEHAPLMVRIAISLSVVYLRSQHFDRALQTLDFAAEILKLYAQQFAESERQTLQIRIASNRALAYGEQGKLHEAIRILLPFSVNSNLDPNTQATFWMNIGVYLEHIGALEEAFAYYQQAWSLVQQSEYPDQEREILILINLGALSLETYNAETAEHFLRQAYDRIEAFGEHAKYRRDILLNLMGALIQQQKLPEIEQILPELLALRSVFRNPMDLSEINNAVAEGLLALEKADEAALYANQAYQQAQAADSPQLIIEALLTRAQIAQQQQQPEAALRLLEEAAQTINADTPLRTQRLVFERLAHHYQEVGEWKKALQKFRQYHQLVVQSLQAQWENRLELIRYQVELETAQQQNKQLEQINRELQELSRTREMFLRMLSHDLKNPLSQIQLSLQLLNPELPVQSNLNRELLDIAQNSIQHAIQILEQSLTFLKLQAGTFTPRLVDCDCTTIIQEAIDAVALSAKQKRQTIKQAVESCAIKTDPSFLRQILVNLLSNAIKYTPEGGVITIHTEHTDQKIGIAVTDTGIGITPANIDRIFEPFFKGDQPTGRETSTGLGLTIVRQLVQALGGTITVDSTPQKGSTFTVWLPKRS